MAGKKHWTVKEIAGEIVPGASVLPLCCVLLLNFLTYFATRPFTDHLVHYSLKLSLDERIPFQTAWIWVYVLAFAQWAVGFVVISWQERRVSDELFAAEMTAKCCALLCFLVLPTYIDRPVPAGSSVSDTLCRFVFGMDEPNNLFPSIHCLESWLCFRSCSRMRQVSPVYRWGMLAASVLVFASTVFLKQHVLVDIPGGILAVELGLLAAKKWRLGRAPAWLRERTRFVPW